MTRRLLLTILAVVCLGQFPAGTVAAHNSLDTSTPSDGTALDVAPSEIVMRFAKDVPLETLTVVLTDPSGVRSDLTGVRHGGALAEVVATLPPLGPGDHTVRWRLVGPDGHAVTGRIGFLVAPAATTTVAATPTTVAATPTVPPTADATGLDDEMGRAAPEPIRWLARYAAYLGIMLVAGLAATEFLLRRPPVGGGTQRLCGLGLAIVAVATVVQLLVLAGDISGAGALSSFGSLDAAVGLDAGMALVARLVMVAAAWLLSGVRRPVHHDTRTDVTLLLALGLLATWSFAGHSRSLRWPALGIPLDVVHHGAAATWLGGLAVLGFVVLRHRADDDAPVLVRRFSRIAEWSVGLIVATGVIQYTRLMEGRLGRGVEALFSTGHGRLVLAKVGLLVAMLWFAARNRRAVVAGLETTADQSSAMTVLRGSIRRELFIGLAVIAVTASLVVTAPTGGD